MTKIERQMRMVTALASGILLASVVFAPTPAIAAHTFNVKTFGAVGDGTHNDTAAIQAALDAANAVPGSTVLFPPGNYLYSEDLFANGIAVVGQRATLTAIADTILFDLTGNHVSMQGMTLASRAVGVTGAFVFRANGFTVANNTFEGGLVVPVQVALSSNGIVKSNKIAVGTNATGVAISQSQLVSLESNVCTGTNQAGTNFVLISASNNVGVTSNRVSGVPNISNEFNNSVVAFQHNDFSGFTDVGFVSTNDQNLTISGNRFSAASGSPATLIIGGGQNVLLSNNSIEHGGTGILSGGTTNVQVSGNTVTDTSIFAVQIASDTTAIVKNNTIQRTGNGINIIATSNPSVTGNQVAQCLGEGIVGTQNLGTETISNNQLRSCGLEPSPTPAVIFVDSPSATSIPIAHNFYSGNTTGLQYFIRCKQPQPPAQVSGNATNTGLPSLIGP